MDIDSYLVMECTWTKNLGKTGPKQMDTFDYANTKTVKCFKYGKILSIRDGDKSLNISAQVYLVKEDIKNNDLIDGQVVKGVSPVPDFDGTSLLKEVYIYES